MEFRIKSLDELNKLAHKIAPLLKGNEIILLSGDLGAGKTALVKKICEALGVEGEVTSPTFNILREYQTGNIHIVHIDCYRLEGMYVDPTVEEYLYDEKMLRFVEWPEFVKGFEVNNPIKIDVSLDGTDRIYKIEDLNV